MQRCILEAGAVIGVLIHCDNTSVFVFDNDLLTFIVGKALAVRQVLDSVDTASIATVAIFI